MKKIFLSGIVVLSALTFIGCVNSTSNKINDTVTETGENKKKEITNIATWENDQKTPAIEVKINNIRKFNEKDKLYKNIKKDFKNNDLYLVEYTYKNIDFEGPLEITLDDFTAYNKNGEVMDLKPQGTESFNDGVGKGKSAKATMIIIAPKGYNDDEITFEVGRYDLEKIEIKQKISN